MQQQVYSQRTINDGLRARNLALIAEVEDLRNGTEASEERARAELGMMRQGELFVQVLPPDAKAPEVKVNTRAPAAPRPSTSAVPAKSTQPR
jgi:cell division protein FtsB